MRETVQCMICKQHIIASYRLKHSKDASVRTYGAMHTNEFAMIATRSCYSLCSLEAMP
jgi:hypothetical protein